MVSHRILIVDDQKEMARMLHSGLDTLEYDLEINDVLSGEEAMLELSRGPIDLLVSDVLLPGISGLELMDKFKKNNESLKVILVSGVTDQKIRKQVAQAGADAFFFKPLELADFLDSVERVLGLVETILPHELHVHKDEVDEEEEAVSMSDRIAMLHKEIKAAAVFLLGDQGKVLVRTGTLPDPEIIDVLVPPFMSVFNAGVRVSHFMGKSEPDNLLAFHGEEYDLYMAYVGEAYCLMIATDPIAPKDTGKIAQAASKAAEDVAANLSKLGVDTSAREGIHLTPAQEETQVEEEPAEEELQSDPELEKLLGATNGEKANPDDADAFWDNFDDKEAVPLPGTGDLSFDQAKKLGLSPSED